jgi:hypothetical protein
MATRNNRTNKNTKTAPTATPEVETTPVEVVEDTTPVEVAEVKAVEAPVAPKATSSGKPTEALAVGLKRYVDAMKPTNPISDVEGARFQKILRGLVINAIMDKDEAQAIDNVKYILSFIHNDNTGTFSIRSLFRFYDSTPWATKEERREIESLLSLFESTCNPATRAKEVAKLNFAALGNLVAKQRSATLIRRLSRAYNLN